MWKKKKLSPRDEAKAQAAEDDEREGLLEGGAAGAKARRGCERGQGRVDCVGKPQRRGDTRRGRGCVRRCCREKGPRGWRGPAAQGEDEGCSQVMQSFTHDSL